MVGAAGLEPATLGLEIQCSIRLSYAPALCGCLHTELMIAFTRASTIQASVTHFGDVQLKAGARQERRELEGFESVASNLGVSI